MSDGQPVQEGRVQANVRKATFRPRRDLDMLFVVIDPAEGRIVAAWSMSNPEFARLGTKPNGPHESRRCRQWCSSSPTPRGRTDQPPGVAGAVCSW
jgi:hypothetical protein